MCTVCGCGDTSLDPGRPQEHGHDHHHQDRWRNDRPVKAASCGEGACFPAFFLGNPQRTKTEV